MLIKVGDLLELAVEERPFYTTNGTDIIAHKEDLFVITSFDDDRKCYTIFHQKESQYLPDFTIDLLNDWFNKVD